MTTDEEAEFDEGGRLKKRTKLDRAREAKSFYTYFEQKASGEKMEDLLLTEDGREKISKIFSNYFFSMEVEGVARPKKNAWDKYQDADT